MKKYNWWEDPKNKKEVERISWWNNPENKHDYMMPISVIKSENRYVAAFNDETNAILGDLLSAVAEGDSEADAIDKMWSIVRFSIWYNKMEALKHQRWVPVKYGGAWKKYKAKWVSIFGIHIYFRYGKKMKGWFYIPLTRLNISIRSEWAMYKKWIKEKKPTI